MIYSKMETTEINVNTAPAESAAPLNEFQLKAIEQAEKDLEKLKSEVTSQKYLVDITKDQIKSLNVYVTEHAPWKFTESLGIVELEKEFADSVKKGKLFISGVATEAIHYYLSKAEGKGKNVAGFKDVNEYISILRGVVATLERVKVDADKVRDAEFVLAARREGIEPDTSHKDNE